MGLQRYRADSAGPIQKNGSVAWYADWIGGPTLALIRNCPIENRNLPPRTVYIRGEADTFFSIPAVCSYRGKRITGYCCCDGNGELVFRAHLDQIPERAK